MLNSLKLVNYYILSNEPKKYVSRPLMQISWFNRKKEKQTNNAYELLKSETKSYYKQISRAAIQFWPDFKYFYVIVLIYAYWISLTVSGDEGPFGFRKQYTIFYPSEDWVRMILFFVVWGEVILIFCFKELVICSQRLGVGFTRFC